MPDTADAPSSRHRAIPTRSIGRLAVRALLDELRTYPKPGLVSLVDRGSHADMDAATLVRSAFALRAYFREVASLGREGCGFLVLRDAGIAAEARMLRATVGVNTHRGAIFMLGLLAAAAGRRGAHAGELDEVIRSQWAVALREHDRHAASHGSVALARHGAGGALAEAAAGLPHVFEVTLPALRSALLGGASLHDAGVHAFFRAMATLTDTNLLHRGGTQGLDDAQRLAAGFMAAGGVFASDWRRHAIAIHRDMCARRLSPGGSADLLAAALFVHALDCRVA